jgi:hypothetical protein
MRISPSGSVWILPIDFGLLDLGPRCSGEFREGARLDEIMAATGWQAHTGRGAIARALKKKLGLTVSSEKVEGRGRVYRIAEAGPA